MKNRKITYVAAGLIFLLALLLTLYPVISSSYNQAHQSQIQTAYREVLEQTDTSRLEEIRKAVQAYNQAMIPGPSGSGYSQEALSAASKDYVNQLNVTGNGIMGYLSIPKIGLSLPIYHGTEADTLERGLGHLLGSSLPVGGASTHAIITGHSGIASQKMFTDLEQFETGDVFYLQVLNETLAYQVDQIQTVLPHDTASLEIVPGEDLCTLVTCTPTGVNTHRLLVRGCRIPYEKAVEVQEVAEIREEEAPSSWEEQYWLGIRWGLAAMFGILLVVNGWIFLRKRPRPARKKGGRYVRK